jgi:hypothetical protein
MGDRSLKAAQKQASKKQAKGDIVNQQKAAAIALKFFQKLGAPFRDSPFILWSPEQRSTGKDR